jgi:hypothetical protein
MAIENDTRTDDDNAGTHATPPPDEAPARRSINLGGQSVELDAEQADLVQRAFDRLAGQFGSRLEEVRREALDTVRVVAQRPESRPAPTAPTAVPLPDPDLLLPNPAQWQEGFARAFDARLSHARQELTALVQAATETIQEDIAQREANRELQSIHNGLRDQMFEQYEDLDPVKHGAFVQAVYEEVYDSIKHLPADQAFDHLGRIATARLKELRQPDAGDDTPAPAATRPQAPALVSSRRASPRTAPQPVTRKTMSDRIFERQEAILRGRKAA